MQNSMHVASYDDELGMPRSLMRARSIVGCLIAFLPGLIAAPAVGDEGYRGVPWGSDRTTVESKLGLSGGEELSLPGQPGRTSILSDGSSSTVSDPDPCLCKLAGAHHGYVFHWDKDEVMPEDLDVVRFKGSDDNDTDTRFFAYLGGKFVAVLFYTQATSRASVLRKLGGAPATTFKLADKNAVSGEESWTTACATWRDSKSFRLLASKATSSSQSFGLRLDDAIVIADPKFPAILKQQVQKARADKRSARKHRVESGQSSDESKF